MLECSSKAEVERILSLDRRWFGSSHIFLDRWTAAVGRSEVLRMLGLSWIRVLGIPMHLRSDDLFRHLGDACGGFLEFDVGGCPLNLVRIKVASSRDILSNIKLHFNKETFVVSVVKEGLELGGRVDPGRIEGRVFLESDKNQGKVGVARILGHN
ncbi:hypothetical protein LINPERPRIM_LOCUS29407 [Linum perenne]